MRQSKNPPECNLRFFPFENRAQVVVVYKTQGGDWNNGGAIMSLNRFEEKGRNLAIVPYRIENNRCYGDFVREC